MIERLLQAIAALFAVSDPDTRLERRTALLFAVILLSGAVVRFWGLGDVGLHGDEKTMSLPAMHLVEQGTPQLPSGMYYARAVGQLYLMAASVHAFGQSEWALRLPSAICGILLIALAWTCGRRFLTTPWNLALTAAVAFLPDFIDDAQTARMYVFLATSVAGFMALVFQWERTGRVMWLVAAVVALLVGIQFHTLAIFAAFLVFFPGLLQGDRRKFWQGMGAFAVIVAGFLAINSWIASAYPQHVAAPSGPVSNGPKAAVIANGVIAALSQHYHLVALLVVAVLVLARRRAPLPTRRVAMLLGALLVLAVCQAIFLYMHGAGNVRQIVGVMLGWPSVWPFLSIAENSPVAAVLACAGIVCGLWQLAHRRPVPDHVLLVVLGVWLPLVLIGFMRWDIPPRYAQAQIMPLLLGAFATAQWGTRRWLEGSRLQRDFAATRIAALAAAIAWALVVNPSRTVDAIDSGYAKHPDHKGAAQFIESVRPGPRDILIAEDVLEQTYYLGKVDYWLVNKQVAAPFMHQVQGRWLDFYTNTPLLGTGEQLREVLDRPGRGAVYVIGSGEDQQDGRKLMRAFGIAAELSSPQFKIVYRGRDGLTRVWKAEAPEQASVAPSAAAGRG